MRTLAAAVVAVAAACHAQPSPPPAPPTCAQVADHVRALFPAANDHAHKLRDVLERRCRDDHWALEVTSCMMDERDLHAGHHCQDQLTAEQRTAFTREVAEIDAPPPPPAPPRGHDWPRECDDYLAAIDDVATCDKIPQVARDAMKQSFEEMSSGWTKLPPEARPALASACKAGADAMRQTFASTCGATP